ncbi:hypothetical protein Apa02nite_075630 [Actinoplanes palleronii]|uniref:Peptidase MA superfamily protein n=1 Tax=Actinoplanes palleronii TaxID=113570 RepID=A0ABQ4BMK0_9ACTN|nr:hypothetical protein Apa02nite_075630 [Actinoplanes palleronii]
MLPTVINLVRWQRIVLLPVAVLLTSVAVAASDVTNSSAWADVTARLTRPMLESGPLPRPAEDAPVSEFQAWIAQEANAVLKVETEGLLSGDFTTYALGAMPDDSLVRESLKSRFRTLRELKVTRFDQRIDGQPYVLPGRDSWRVVVIADHCFVETDCATDEAVFDSRWKVTPDGLKLTGFRVHDRTHPCFSCSSSRSAIVARPWETTELVAKVGKRTLVAVPLKYRARLAELAARAESAAVIADRYQVGDGKVDRYRLFIADPVSWSQWYYGYPGAWAAGLAAPTGPNRIEVEAAESALTPGYADELLTHELAHVSTLRNDTTYGQDDVWFLVEGMAEYVMQQGVGGKEYRRGTVVRHLTQQRPLRSVMVQPPAVDADLVDAQARYAVGYYALEYLFKHYGKAKTLAFFRGAVQYGIGLDGASQSAFGTPWAKVDRECAAYVRKL